MTDLNSIMFYKAKFTISATNRECDLLWKVILHIRSWQTNKWNRNDQLLDTAYSAWTNIKFGNRIFSLDGNSTVYIESEYHKPSENEEHWACKIIENRPPKSGFCKRQWVTEIGFQRDTAMSAVFSCVLTYSDIPGFIGPSEDAPGLSIPNLIRLLIEDNSIKCYMGRDIISTSAQHLKAGDFPAFWERLISSERIIPYIYISPKRKTVDSEDVVLPIEPTELAEAVCANAYVFYSDTLDFSREMSYLCDENYSCYSGQVKVYFPNVDINDTTDQYRHRYLTQGYISDIGAEATIKIFRKALAQNVNFYESFFRLTDCRRMKSDAYRSDRLAQIHSEHQREISKISEQKWDVTIAEEEKRLVAESEVEQLRNELSREQTKNYSLEIQVENMRGAFSRCRDMEEALTERLLINKYPENKNDIVDYFVKTFSDTIAFSEDAMKTLKTLTLSNSELWKVIFSLATEMRDLFFCGSPDPYGEFKEATGLDCARGEGMMTRKDKKLMRQFETTYDGRTIDIEPHITFAKEGQSIHFGYDNISQKIIIGSCGEHKKIYSKRG